MIDYELVEVIGEGSFGVVYLVQDEKDRKYALKKVQVNPFLVDESLLEIKLLGKFNHPNLIYIYDSSYDPANQTLKILMEYCEEGDLLMYFKKKNRKLEDQELLSIFKQISRAFLAMNAQGVIHRDLKPENVLVCSNGLIKIADFGEAKSVPLDKMSKIVQMSLEKGTAIYSSPQQLTGEPYSAKCDVWSAGCLLYFLYFGRHPFFELTVPETVEKAKLLTQNKQIELPQNIDPSIGRFLQSSLVYEDQERATWRELSLCRIFHKRIDNVKSFLVYVQNISNIANWMTKEFWKVRKEMHTTPEKNEIFAYFMIKFQYSFNLMAIEIINKSPRHSYLFTPEAYSKFSPKDTDEAVKDILSDQEPRANYYTSIRNHMSTKPVYESIKFKEQAKQNAFADLDSSIRACYQIVSEVYPQLKEQNPGKDNSLIWVLMSKWMNFQLEFGFEKNCRIEELFKMTILSPASVVESEVIKYESGMVDY